MKRVLVVVAILCLVLSGTALADEPIKIGAVFAVSGSASWLGEPERNTVKMIEAEVNAAGGINGTPIEVIVEDTVGDDTKTVNAVKKLIAKDNAAIQTRSPYQSARAQTPAAPNRVRNIRIATNGQIGPQTYSR